MVAFLPRYSAIIHNSPSNIYNCLTMPLEKTFFDFLKDLSKNNNTEWFHANKKRYETQFKEPFIALLEEIVAKMVKFEPELAATPVKSMMFRINRDIRFSKNK